MKGKLLALFLIFTLVCTILVPVGTVFADTDDDESGTFAGDDESGYMDSLEQGDIHEEEEDLPTEEALPEEIVKPKTQFDDIAGEECEEAVRVLSEIGVIYGMTADEYDPDGLTTRGQMASIILRMLNLDNVSAPTSQVFADVPTTHHNFNDITSAYNLGIIEGNGDGTFNPEGNVLYPEAVKMLVCALGYDVLAQSKGGYPAGYYSVASQIDLTMGIDLKNEPIPRSDTAIMLYNALKIDIYERTSYGDEETYGSVKNDNVLTRYLGYDYVEGIVTDNGISSLTSSSNIDFDQIKIDTVIFNNGGIDSSKLLGRAVKGYYKVEKGKALNTLTICFVDDMVCSELVLTHDDILLSSRENGSFVFDYMEGDTQRKTSVYSDSYIYNGKSVGIVGLSDPAFATMISNLECGTVTLVSNNGDKVYDVLFIDEYMSYEVQRVDTFGLNIYCDDLTGTSYVINLDSEDILFSIFNEKGVEVEFSSLRAGDVISFYESNDNKVYRIYISRKKETGIIQEITDDNIYVINGQTYKRYPDLLASELTVGKNAVYLIDIYGNIVNYSDDTAESGSYALLMDVHVPAANSGLDVYPQIRILKTDGEYETALCENKVKAYNDMSGNVELVNFADLICTDAVELDYANVSPYMLWYTNNSANFTYDIRANNLAGAYQKRFYYRPWLSTQEKSDIASRKIIYYETNADGRIDTIIVPDVPAPYNKLSTMNPATSYGMIYRSESNIAIDYVTPSTIKISPHAVVFQGLALDYTEKDYWVAENGVYSINNGTICKMYLYSLNGSDSAGIVLRYYHLPYESRGNLIPVVVSAVTRDSEDKIHLYGYSQGRELEAVIKNDTTLVQRNIYYDDILTTSNSSRVDSLTFQNRVNGKNLFGYMHSVANDLDGSSKATKSFYDLYEGMSWPYADEESIKKGDILLVGYNNGDELCYVQMMMRADDGLMQVTRESTDFAGKVTNGNDFAMGVVRGFNGASAQITIHGPLDTWNRNYTTYGDLKVSTSTSKQADGRFNALGNFGYETHDFEVGYSQCVVWEYDYNRNTMKKLNGNALKTGDTVIIRGNEYSPREVIVLKNYTTIPELSDYEAYEAMN